MVATRSSRSPPPPRGAQKTAAEPRKRRAAAKQRAPDANSAEHSRLAGRAKPSSVPKPADWPLEVIAAHASPSSNSSPSTPSRPSPAPRGRKRQSPLAPAQPALRFEPRAGRVRSASRRRARLACFRPACLRSACALIALGAAACLVALLATRAVSAPRLRTAPAPLSGCVPDAALGRLRRVLLDRVREVPPAELGPLTESMLDGVRERCPLPSGTPHGERARAAAGGPAHLPRLATAPAKPLVVAAFGRAGPAAGPSPAAAHAHADARAAETAREPLEEPVAAGSLVAALRRALSARGDATPAHGAAAGAPGLGAHEAAAGPAVLLVDGRTFGPRAPGAAERSTEPLSIFLARALEPALGGRTADRQQPVLVLDHAEAVDVREWEPLIHTLGEGGLLWRPPPAHVPRWLRAAAAQPDGSEADGGADVASAWDARAALARAYLTAARAIHAARPPLSAVHLTVFLLFHVRTADAAHASHGARSIRLAADAVPACSSSAAHAEPADAADSLSAARGAEGDGEEQLRAVLARMLRCAHRTHGALPSVLARRVDHLVEVHGPLS